MNDRPTVRDLASNIAKASRESISSPGKLFFGYLGSIRSQAKGTRETLRIREAAEPQPISLPEAKAKFEHMVVKKQRSDTDLTESKHQLTNARILAHCAITGELLIAIFFITTGIVNVFDWQTKLLAAQAILVMVATGVVEINLSLWIYQLNHRALVGERLYKQLVPGWRWTPVYLFRDLYGEQQ